MNVSRTPATTPGPASGNVTEVNVDVRVAPRSFDASRNAGSIRSPYAAMPADFAEFSRECGRRWAVLNREMAAGRRLEDLNLQALSVELTAIRRRNIRSLDPTPETAFVEGDVVVLRGRESDLALAEARLLQG